MSPRPDPAGVLRRAAVAQRNASPHTSAHTVTPSGCCSRSPPSRPASSPVELDIDDLDAPLIGAFLNHLEQDRGNSPRTRNNRLAAIHSFYRLLGAQSTPSTSRRSHG